MTDGSCAVIITAKNAETTIAKAVGSALAQGPASEVVVVDDASTDQTVIAALSSDDGSGRLKLIRHEVNKGPSAGRNAAIAASSAPFLCILDADDFMSAGRLERVLSRGGDDWDLLADDVTFATGPSEAEAVDRLLPDGFATPAELSLTSFANGNVPRRDRPRRELGFLKPLMRRAFLARHGLGYDVRLRLGEDFILYCECLLAGARFRLVEACGYHAVERPDSLSVNHRTTDIGALYDALCELIAAAQALGADTAGLKAKTDAVRKNLAFRRLLDAKRDGDWPGVLAAFADSPGGALHIVSEVVRARVSRLGGAPPANSPQGA